MAMRRGHGEGSVFQRHAADCRKRSGAKTCICPWYAQIDHGWIGGKRVRPTRVATRDDGKRATKADAVRTLEAMRLEKRAGVITSAASLSTWLDYWLDHIVDPSDLKAATKTYYRSHVDQWLKPLVGKVRLDKLGPEHVRGLHASMRAAGKSPTTIRNAHATLRRALTAALAERRITYNWAREVTAPSAADNPHPQLTRDQAGRLIAVAARDPRELARVHVAVLLGLRQGEALALRWEDVDLDARTIRVEWSAARVAGSMVRQRPKTARSVRTVPLPPAAAHSLTAWRKASGGDGQVFHGYSGADSIEGAERDYRAWRQLLEDAQLPRVPLHGARGTCASMLEAAGCPPRMIADILGQADVRITETHYTRSDPQQRADALATIAKPWEIEG